MNYIIKKLKNLYVFSREQYDITKNTYIDYLRFPNPFFNKKDIHHYIFYIDFKRYFILPHAHGDVKNLMIYGEKKWILYDINKITAELTETYGKKYNLYILCGKIGIRMNIN